MPERAEWQVAVIIPAFEAAPAVARTVAGVRVALPAARVIVVDDGSSDGTAQSAAMAGADVLRHATNRGKGAALQTGLVAAVADGAGLLATLDADGQHDPVALPRLLEPLATGQADLTLGARARTGGMPPQRRLSNWLSSRLASRVGREPIPDAQTGFRAFTRAVAAAVRPVETRYDYELAFLLGAMAAGYRIRSIPVPTIYQGAASHFRSVVDTWRVARVFLRYSGRILTGAS